MGRPKGSKNKPKPLTSGELTPSSIHHTIGSETEEPDELRETLEGMSALAVGQQASHPWWRAAQALLAVLDSDEQAAIDIARKAFN